MTSAFRTRPLRFAAAAGARAGFERAVEIDMRCLPRRHESEDDAGGERDEQSESEDEPSS